MRRQNIAQVLWQRQSEQVARTNTCDVRAHSREPLADPPCAFDEISGLNRQRFFDRYIYTNMTNTLHNRRCHRPEIAATISEYLVQNRPPHHARTSAEARWRRGRKRIFERGRAHNAQDRFAVDEVQAPAARQAELFGCSISARGVVVGDHASPSRKLRE
jgi:hypothetical protein